MFVNMGIRVIAIDCVGYGRTVSACLRSCSDSRAKRTLEDSPDPSMEPYTVKSTASDIVTLAEQLGYKKIILGGHDWYVPFEMPTVRRSFEPSDDTYARGGLIVQRTAQYHPSTVTHVFSICTPYFPIMQTYYPINLLIKAFPSYQYMLQFSKGLIEPQVRSRNEIREFLNSVHGFPQGPDGEKGFTPSTGFIVENFPKLACSELFTEGELDFYVQEYARHGVNGPFKWYRTRELNFVDDFAEFISPKDSSEKLREDPGIEQEVLHVLTLRDEVFPRHVCEATEKGFKKLTKATMDADHWVLWSEPKELNEILEKWILEKVL